jgi:lysozyme family protein
MSVPDFDKAVSKLLREEGGYVNDPRDPGGETKYGISKRWLLRMGLGMVNVSTITVPQASEWYRKHWWDEYQYGKVHDQRVAEELLDMAVVAGPRAAHKCIQRAMIAVGWARGVPSNLIDDGVLGPISRNALQEYTEDPALALALLAAFKSEQAGWFRGLDDKVYEKGWVARAYR